MNERIRELSAEAWRYANNYIGDDVMPQLKRYEQKFAELIVRECANAAYQSLYEDRIFDDSPHIIRTKVMDDIKKHFGVK